MKTIGLSNVQKELLKLYANDVSEETLLEIKQIIAKYFAEKATSAMYEFWAENNLTQQTMVDWTNEHNRAQTCNL
ncbi:MAG: hypothetical protein ACR2J3_06335 [Aridibacter sp.]